MEYWDKESPSETHSQSSFPKASDSESQLGEKTPSLKNPVNTNSCSIIVNGQVIAEVDVSNVDDVQKIVSTLSKKRKNSKDFVAETKSSMSQLQTPEGSRTSSVEFTPSVGHSPNDFQDDGSLQKDEFQQKRQQISPYGFSYPQNPHVNTQDQPSFSYRNTQPRLPSAISSYTQKQTGEEYIKWKQQQAQFSSNLPQQFSQAPNEFMKADYYWERRNSMPSYAPLSPAPRTTYNEQPPQQQPKLTPSYSQQMKESFQNYLYQQQQQQQQQRYFQPQQEESFPMYPHQQQQQPQMHYQNPYQQPMYNPSYPIMPSYQSSFTPMQKPMMPSGWSSQSFPLNPKTSAQTPAPEFIPRSNPDPPSAPSGGSRRNSASAVELRKGALPLGKSKDSEQKRRNRINERLTDLKDLLPEFSEHPEKSATKEEILSETIRYIRLLESECVELTEQITDRQRGRVNTTQSAPNYSMMADAKDLEHFFSKRPPQDDGHD